MVRKISVGIVLCSVFFFQGEYLFAQSRSLRNVEVLILKGAYQQAARECEQILVHHHQSKIRSKVYYLLGISLLKQAEFEQARKNFKLILRRYPSSKYYDDASLSIANSYFLEGNYAQAKRSYAQFLQDFAHSELSSIARKQLEQSKQGGHLVSSYFSVQVGSFAQKRNAERLREELINAGYQAYILKWPADSLFRVRVGRFSNRLQAELLEQKLKAEGYSTKVSP